MKHRLLIFKNKWQVPFHLGCAFLPACLLIGAYAAPGQPWHCCLIAAVYVFCALGCILVPDRIRLVSGGLSAAAILFTGFMLLRAFKNPAIVLPTILYGWLMFATLPTYGGDSRDELPPYIFVTGIVIHLIGQLALFVARINESDMFLAVKPGLSAAFLGFFLLTLLNLNRSNLVYTVAMGRSVPRHIYRFNRVLTLILAAVTVFVGCIPAVVRFIRALWNACVRLIAAFIAWINSLIPVREPVMETDGGGRGDQLFAAAESEPGLLAKLLEVVMYIILAGFAVLAVWLAVRYIRRFVRWLWKRFQEYALSTGTGDYVDEISDTREDGVRRRLFARLERRKDPLRGVNERKLAPGPRVRFYYLRLLLKHPDWKASRTARENLSGPAAAIYERARYSKGEITEADAADFLELTGGKK